MSQQKIDILEKALKRERLARKAAEKILEEKSLELYQTNQNLSKVLSEKEIQLESLFKTIVDPYILMDLYGNVLKMNNASIDFFGYNIERDSFNVLSTLHKDDYEYAMESFKQLLKEGSFKNFKARVYNKKRELKWIEINSSIVYDDDDKPTFAQGIIRDISDDLKVQKEREELLKKLTISNKELKDFAHVVSHDLKSPLRSMNALVTWLQEDCEPFANEDIKQNFDYLFRKIDKMDHLISGILKYASVDRVEAKKQQTDLAIIVQEIIDTIHIPEHIKIEVSNDLPTIRGDKFRLHQLFQNLISNAVKYSKPENGFIQIDCEEKDEKWKFSIKDNGIGIEKKYHRKIFDIFQTLDDSQSSTGVGLSIVKKILAIYNGKIWLTSEFDKGTTFYFTLPK
ncbi:histidine kinase [Tenacibaculum holothuriorum]|uniref:histidine kinase n=1 Tax=Tenacibaculum holothuriorum TaxID=1635173 RepID=A0A1Y2PCZ0_9FLAO|nr:PAS domain-containing sensor histidine kinase [Tenacibaculum holothuriorum]OSY87667.1 histidine kinase [Tenacibaculum holothuriorum]